MTSHRNEKIQDVIATYGACFPKRETMAQKRLLIRQVLLDFEPAGFKVVGITEKAKMLTSMNIHIGDLTDADTIFVAHYDRPFKSYFKHFYHPFLKTGSVISKIFSEQIVSLIILGLGALFYGLGFTLQLEWMKLIALLGVPVGLGATLTTFPKGIRNKNNFNKNNSSIIALLLLAEKLKGTDHHVAFVLTDNECLNHHGDLMLRKYLDKKKIHASIIHMDCVGRGNVLEIGAAGSHVNLANRLIKSPLGRLKPVVKLYPESLIKGSSLQSYPVSVNITVGDPYHDDIAVSGVCTSKDSTISEEVIQDVVEFLADTVNKTSKR